MYFCIGGGGLGLLLGEIHDTSQDFMTKQCLHDSAFFCNHSLESQRVYFT